MKRSMHAVIAVLIAAPLLLWTGASKAYPDKPVKFVVTYAAGGGTDIMARLLAPKLSAKFGQPFLVENRPGANGNIAAEMVAAAKPDGYVLLFASDATITINVSLYEKLTFDPAKDLAPVTLLAFAPLVLIVHPSLPVTSVQELIALARSRPGKLTFASPGLGSTHHLAGELLKFSANVDWNHIPYKGFAPAVVDVLSGAVDMLFGTTLVVAPHITNRTLRPLAIASASRFAGLPNVPTMSEAGLPGFEAGTWFGVLAPAKTPAKVVRALQQEMAGIVNSEDVSSKFKQQGLEVIANTPEQFAQRITTETKMWAEVVRKSGAKID